MRAPAAAAALVEANDAERDGAGTYHAWSEETEEDYTLDDRRWSLPECVLCWQWTHSLTVNARNNILWNLFFQALGLVTVIGSVALEGELQASDIATLVNVAIAVPILSLLARALRHESSSMMKALNRWVIAVTAAYTAAVLLDLVSAARWGAACLYHSATPLGEPNVLLSPPALPPASPPSLSPPPPISHRHHAASMWHLSYTCWHGHRRATLMGQLIADGSSLYTFGCQIYFNQLLLRLWSARHGRGLVDTPEPGARPQVRVKAEAAPAAAGA